MIEYCWRYGIKPKTIGADKGYSAGEFIRNLITKTSSLTYRWLSIGSTLRPESVRETIYSDIKPVRLELKKLMRKYNFKWVHSTTGEVPYFRFQRAKIKDSKSVHFKNLSNNLCKRYGQQP